MVMVQAGMVICIPAFLLGSMLAEGMPTLQAMVAGVIGYGMVLVLTLILGHPGRRSWDSDVRDLDVDFWGARGRGFW